MINFKFSLWERTAILTNLLFNPLKFEQSLIKIFLSRSRFLNDLAVKNDERKLLWKSLRERAENSSLYKVDLPEIDIDPMLLTALLGIRE